MFLKYIYSGRVKIFTSLIVVLFILLHDTSSCFAERPKIREGAIIISINPLARKSLNNEATANKSKIIKISEPAFRRFFNVSRIKNKFLILTSKRSRHRDLFASQRRNYCNDKRVKHILSYLEKSIQCEPDSIERMELIPNDPYFLSQQQWYLDSLTGIDLNAPEAWETTTGSRTVVIGIVDSGIDITHPDLSPNLWQNTGEIAGDGIDNDNNGVADDINGYNAISNSGMIADENGHGTHVAGIIGALGNNNIGVVGINWQVSLLPAKFLDRSGSGLTSNAIKALDYMNDLKESGINLVAINNSWGSARSIPSDAMLQEIQRSQRLGILFVAAAGNSAVNNDNFLSPPMYPASYALDNIISVAASTKTGSLASFSNYGVISVDLAAPGLDILSTYINGQTPYQSLSGTSMATPQVTGVAALISAILPHSSFALIKKAILDSVTPNRVLEGKVLSAGILNAKAALDMAQQLDLNALITPTQTATPSSTASVTSSPTATSTATYTATNIVTVTSTPLPSATETPTPSPTVTPTETPTIAITVADTATPIVTASATPSSSPTVINSGPITSEPANPNLIPIPEVTVSDDFNTLLPAVTLRFVGKKSSKLAIPGARITFESSGVVLEPILVSFRFDKNFKCQASKKSYFHGKHSFRLPSLARGLKSIEIEVKASGRSSRARLLKKIRQYRLKRSLSAHDQRVLCRQLIHSFS